MKDEGLKDVILKDQRLFKDADNFDATDEQKYKKLHQILETTFSAHQRADWSNEDARDIIATTIVRRFKDYIEKQS